VVRGDVVSNRASGIRLKWNVFYLIILLCMLLLCVPTTSAQTPHNGVSIYALNANVKSALKVKRVNEAIGARKPDFAVICETKTMMHVATRIQVEGYKVFENVGAKRAVKGAK
jgi:hypothetical protein